MATAPTYMADSGVFVATVSTVNTARDGTGSFDSPVWKWTGSTSAPATQWQFKRYFLGYTGDPADSVITVFTWDGSAAKFWFDIDLANPTAASTTVTGNFGEYPLAECVFPGGMDLRFAVTVAPVSGSLAVTGFCEKA